MFKDLGHEELGKRGCLTKELSSLDADLKGRFVTTEELYLALSAQLRNGRNDLRVPCTWWDRSCDVGLLVGTFVHGLSSHESMRNDEELPFAGKIREQASVDVSSSAAHLSFLAAASVARTVFDNALDSAKSKAQEEAHAVVAAAVAATKIAEELNSNTGTDNRPASITPEDLQLNEDADDTHLVTLTRLASAMASAAREGTVKSSTNDIADITSKENESNDENQQAEKETFPLHHHLPMPDARVLDNLLVQLIGHMEGDLTLHDSDTVNGSSYPEWQSGKDAIMHEEARSRALSTVLGMTKKQVNDERCDFRGIGYNGAQCAAAHRSLDDGSDYFVGAASAELSHVSSGSDAPRYLRALGVPMNITRYAASALVHADSTTLQSMLSNEESRNFMEYEESDDGSDAEKEVDAADSEVVAAKPRSEVDTNSSADVASQLPSSPAMAPAFRDSASLRAGLCASALHHGYTTVVHSNVHVDAAIRNELGRHFSSREANHFDPLYSLGSFISAAASIMGQVNMPSADAISQYVESILLPHCLRVCVMGNGPSTRNARGSKGKYETAYGISNYPEYTWPRQTPLPDPCASLEEHSIEAVACASAILRRVRLMRASQHIVSGEVTFAQLMGVLQSNVIRDSMGDLPIWWCPEVHDLGLLVHAATRGLFSILGDRRAGISNSVFCPETIKQHIYTTFFSPDEAKSKQMANNVLPDAWVEEQSLQFPSATALERRLGLLCSQATAHLGNDIARYDNLPMFDHGGWPR